MRAVVVFVLLVLALPAIASGLPLVDAAKRGDAALVKTLLQRKANPNEKEADGTTALHWAVYFDRKDIAEALLRGGADVNAETDLGVTPLWIAADNASDQMIATLLKGGADPNRALMSGETVLMAASRSGSLEAVRLLLSRNADPAPKETWRQQTALMWAIAHGHSEIARLLIDVKSDVTARTSAWWELVNPNGAADGSGVMWVKQGGFTPLLFAAREGDLPTVRRLLQAGGDVNDAAASGASALVIAAHSGNRAVAQFLLERGARPDDMGAGYGAIHAALLLGDLELVKALLAHGADPNLPLRRPTAARRASEERVLRPAFLGATPFWLAARFGQIEILKILAEAGADPMFVKMAAGPAVVQISESGGRPLPEPPGMTTLMAAVAPERLRSQLALGSALAREEEAVLEAVRLIVSRRVDVNAKDADGETALHRAVTLGFVSVVEHLVERGADVNVKNVGGVTPLMKAQAAESEGGGGGGRRRASSGMVELLKKLGATQ
jgi:ankyrin repeat protein